MSLKEYRRKRKFDQTPEPAPSSKKQAAKGNPTFVVQRHDASREHYDFRLEVDGALKSWAVPKGPTLTSGSPRLAMKVEDHPIEYGGFEGTIPKGNYGAGTVMVWDRGTYIERNSKSRKESDQKMLEGLKSGHITFLMDGEKLRGEFALVRMKKKGAPENGWLLLKKHDAEASRMDVTKQNRSVLTGRSMQQIAEQAEAKGEVWHPQKGRNKKAVPPPSTKLFTSLARKVVDRKDSKKVSSSDNSMPRKVRVMEPVFAAKAPAEGEWAFEPFRVGSRAVAEVEPHVVKLYSRSFLPFEKKYPAVVSALKALKTHAVLDGEIIKKGNEEVFLIGDILFHDGKDLREQPQKKRRGVLEKLKLEPPLELVKSKTSVAALELGRIATVVAKKTSSPYQNGLSKDWLRFKMIPARAGKTSNTISSHDKPPLTHGSKIYWPKEGYTKADLYNYYDKMSDWIIPHMIDKPQSLHRQPDGIKNEGFFHKDQKGFLPRRIPTAKMFSGSSGATTNYLICNDRWTLLYLANLGCIELNPWLSRHQKPEHPELLVIDLDPDDNDFDEVIEVAKEVHEVLESVGAEGFLKTSGASGLHICVPTGEKFDYDLCREFAHGVCQLVHKKFQKNTSLERNPTKRLGKIYLDYMQNRRGQTLAAPYCVRPRPKATVSAPLKWSELKKGLTPEAFTIETIEARVKKVGDLWKPMLDVTVDIKTALRKLSRLLHN
jgi:DNA ligase D-like protein (predicted polymerase)/DNA ligase D-like protein (predicted 3'-phosphoesterase)